MCIQCTYPSQATVAGCLSQYRCRPLSLSLSLSLSVSVFAQTFALSLSISYSLCSSAPITQCLPSFFLEFDQTQGSPLKKCSLRVFFVRLCEIGVVSQNDSQEIWLSRSSLQWLGGRVWGGGVQMSKLSNYLSLTRFPPGESQPPTNNWITDKLGLVPWFLHRHHLQKYMKKYVFTLNVF